MTTSKHFTKALPHKDATQWCLALAEEAGQPDPVIRAAPTGVAAFSIAETTLHSDQPCCHPFLLLNQQETVSCYLTEGDIAFLNRRIQWMMKNQQRGLLYLNIDLYTAKLFVFVDGSFANNKDCNSQIGFLIILATEDKSGGSFQIQGNLITASSTKCKRVTRSVLASETYRMVSGLDIAICVATTLNMVTSKLQPPEVPIIVCTDSYSLYECLVKLGTTKEKTLMIDIMALRQSYERRELAASQKRKPRVWECWTEEWDWALAITCSSLGTYHYMYLPYR
ncbi:polyprotein [Drepanopeziza brunnea f. sp. 'multigermtubi' MB_m1]|uniref:Polyprotein n=1 Tax=Marssonina brunnea f. sp. multigermtubi (strain MB_m1) TaxID=1072389 RepID=K1X587_MARBU|nr:polyprotein [Drepanopeziza brunnea f. sp. 'multigermtubi' MB_m1]EKD20252.1 polyprotein [Drepanopeziza brunnea f. sp. 'multigermtubi' MB_m1]